MSSVDRSAVRYNNVEDHQNVHIELVIELVCGFGEATLREMGIHTKDSELLILYLNRR